MTWHTNISSTPSTSSVEQEAAFSLTSYLDTIRLERAKSNPTQEMSSSPDNETDILPAFPIWDDVCTLDGTPWRGTVDVLCGGFPCQDISAAGKGAGITGERSGLWKEYARLIGEMRPRFVFAENSPLLRTRGLGVVLEDLAALGYDARWGMLGAGDVGAWHQRKRLWLLASDNLQKRVKGEWPQSVARKLRLPGCENVRRLEDLQGRPDIPDSLIRGDRNGVPSYVDRIAAIGNAQVPQVAAMAFNILSEGLI
jgi:DNA (cytosine-5)-methyltransferase 1